MDNDGLGPSYIILANLHLLAGFLTRHVARNFAEKLQSALQIVIYMYSRTRQCHQECNINKLDVSLIQHGHATLFLVLR